MSNFKASEDGTEEKPEFSLTQAVEDVSQHGHAQTVALKEKQKTLSGLQRNLAEVKMVVDMVEQDVRSQVRTILQDEAEIEHLQHQTKALYERIVSISKKNTKLQFDISEEEENARTALAGFNNYRKKMEGHRAAVKHAATQTEAHKELEEKKELVGKLMQKKEKLKEDLENPCGNTVQVEKREIDALEEEVSVRSKTTDEKRDKVKNEFALHVKLEKEIQIQNRRYEAIMRRLHCQTTRIQAAQKQLSEDIHLMDRQLGELKRQQKSKQDSAVSDH
uniref:coiled-coil domain-containing protein 122 n=1 Tax=Semicossyphus pulcher TaxID=241346 RepID=UPI0037E86184